jgi:hypothetical protein
MLLEDNRPRDLTEFEATMKIEPNRFRALYGAARAVEQAGELETARDYYRKLLELCDRADQPKRPEVQQARSALARRY